jgi:hypothetical protein
VLWQTDGTEAGTTVAQDFDPRPGADMGVDSPVVSGPSGSILYVDAFSPDSGFELWRMPPYAPPGQPSGPTPTGTTTATPTPAGPPAAAPASLVAGLRISGKTSTRRVGRRGILVRTAFAMTCPSQSRGCTWRLTASSVVPATVLGGRAAKTKRITIGTAKGSVKAGKRARLQFRLNKRGVNALRKLKSMKVRLKITLRVAGPGGTTRTVTRTVTIKAPPKKKPRQRSTHAAAAL